MLYIIENNGVYGLTKGQFSASADIGTKAKRAMSIRRRDRPCIAGLTLGATFVARSFSGDKAQLVPLIQAGCVTTVCLDRCALALRDFNDHEARPQSYTFTREHTMRRSKRISCRERRRLR